MPTQDVFDAGQRMLQNAFPRTAKLTADQRRTWYEMLSDLTDQQYTMAVAELIRSGDDWPTISKLRAAAMPAGLDYETRAEVAWAALRPAVASVGGYRSVQFDDPVINATVRALWGSWRLLCETTTEDLTRSKLAFLRTYARLSEAGVSHLQAAPMAGIHDTDRSREGGNEQEPDPVVMIETHLAPDSRLRIHDPDVVEPRRLGNADVRRLTDAVGKPVTELIATDDMLAAGEQRTRDRRERDRAESDEGIAWMAEQAAKQRARVIGGAGP
jgi:hypothetical protein